MRGIVMRWATGVTTVPSRRYDLLPKTLASLRAGGFTSSRLFVDGSQHGDMDYQQFGLETTYRYPTVRAYGNWILALLELYIREPVCDRYAIFQDDFVTYKELRTYLERPGVSQLLTRGYLNLYLMPSNHRDVEGWYEGRLLNCSNKDSVAQTGRGAVGLVFDRRGVQVLLSQTDTIERIADPDVGYKKIDGGVVNAMNKVGYREYVHNPSLTQHMGERSAVGNHPHPKADSFRGENFDVTILDFKVTPGVLVS